MSEAEEPLLPHSQPSSHQSTTIHPSSNTLSLASFLPFFFSSNHRRNQPDASSTPLQRPKSRKANLSWRNRRITKSTIIYFAVLLTLVLIYFRYLHHFIFIDYSLFPPLTGLALIHPGTDPESSVPPAHFHRIPLTTSTKHHSNPHNTIHRPSSHHLDHNLLIDRALQDISRRFQSVWIQPSTLACNPSNETRHLIHTRFLNPTNGKPNGRHKVMIALNLHSSQDVLPALTTAILNTLRYIGLDNVFLSIYENGSWDHTPEGLGHLGAVLTGLGVGHRLRSAKEETSWAGVDRIKILSEYRNVALSALDEAERHLNGLTELVFINDVFLCAQDILEIIWERNFQNADASCGTDWKESEKLMDRLGWSKSQKQVQAVDASESKHQADLAKSVVFYDSWVARSLSGNTLRPRLDFLSDYRDGYSVIFDREDSKVYRARFQNSLPVPVYSCWNGIISLNPKPFLPPINITFRSADRAHNECPSSECQLLAKDFWSLGFHKWILVPKVAVTYTQGIYYSESIVRGSDRNHRKLLAPSHPKIHNDLGSLSANSDDPNHDDDEYTSTKINWNKYQKPETVVCWPDMHNFHLDFEWNHVLESPYNPKLINSTLINKNNDHTTSSFS